MFRDFSVRSGEFVVLCGVERGNVETDAVAPTPLGELLVWFCEKE